MGLFSRKPKVNLDDVFKEKYKALNQTMMQAHQEMDDFIKESLLCQVVNMYDELLSYIDQGAHFDKEHFFFSVNVSEKYILMLKIFVYLKVRFYWA